MDVNNGDIISMVSYPDFNINERMLMIEDINYINRALQKVFMNWVRFLKLLLLQLD